MDLVLLGINHNLLQGPLKLRKKLINLHRFYKFKNKEPAFVAVEWKQTDFEIVSSQRNSFKNLLIELYPQFNKDTATPLSLSLGYEGDTHIDIWPNTKTVWLDQTRPTTKSCTKDYAIRKINILKSFSEKIDNFDPDFLNIIDKTAWELAENDQNNEPLDERENKWINLLSIEKNLHNSNHWGIVVIGNNHVENENLKMSLKNLDFELKETNIKNI